jgi:hypothetical protein
MYTRVFDTSATGFGVGTSSASADAPDKWVAVLNLRETIRRGYWSRTHDLIHRIAEPRQFRPPFYRHRPDKTNPLESLID